VLEDSDKFFLMNEDCHVSWLEL